jgi:HK97 family phage major capsid protein
MPNVVLDRLREARDEQISTIDAILGQVGEERDLVDAERNLLEAARQRINEIDAQIEPLAGFEALRATHNDTVSALPRPETAAVRAAAAPTRPSPWSTPGEFIVDYIRGNSILDRSVRDEQAASRLGNFYAQRADMTTTQTPGLLPTPIIGQVVSLIDSFRPLITSLGGARGLGGIPGTTFTRPKVTTHTTVGVQATQKTALSSQAMVVSPVTFTKATYGGYVDISRQDIYWTSPAAWDIVVRDLAEVYSVQTETAVAANFKTAATGTAVSVGTAAQPVTLSQWATGLYTAAMHSYQQARRMPDRIWCSLDVWAALGALVDTTRVVLPVDTTREMGAPGTSQLGMFAGDLFGLPRIVVPTFASGTLIVGPSTLYEVYEEVIGLLSVIEPSILGVQVAYGGYVAFGTLDTTSFVPLTVVGTLPTVVEEAEAVLAEGEADEAQREPGDGPGTPRARGRK